MDLDAFLADLGGQTEPQDAPRYPLFERSRHVARTRAQSFRGWVNLRGRALKLACGYANVAEINAVCGVEGDTQCLAVYEPLVIVFADFFSAMLSHPLCLTDLGEAQRESSARATGRMLRLGRIGEVVSDGAVFDSTRDLLWPICPYRAAFALHMTHIALDFIWCHEIWHAALGHAEYARTLNIRRLGERPNGSSPRTMLPLEAEADEYAAYWIISQAFQTHTPYLAMQTPLQPIDRLKLIRLALILTNFMWAHLQRLEAPTAQAADSTEDSHPSPLVRFHFALRNANTYCKAKHGISTAIVQDLDAHLARECRFLASQFPLLDILSPAVVFSSHTIANIEKAGEEVTALRRMIDASIEPHRFFAA